MLTFNSVTIVSEVRGSRPEMSRCRLSLSAGFPTGPRFLGQTAFHCRQTPNGCRSTGAGNPRGRLRCAGTGLFPLAAKLPLIPILSVYSCSRLERSLERARKRTAECVSAQHAFATLQLVFRKASGRVFPWVGSQVLFK